MRRVRPAPRSPASSPAIASMASRIWSIVAASSACETRVLTLNIA
jgi:hypothetical protein